MDENAFILYVTDELDDEFFRRFVKVMLQASTYMEQNYGYYAEKAEFRGKFAKPVFEEAIERKYNFGLEINYKDHYDESILLTGTRKVNVVKEEGGMAPCESMNGKIVKGWVKPPELSFGSLGYTVEKTKMPEICIKLINLNI